MTGRIILASGSAIRARILSEAGIDFDIVKTDVDEDAIKRRYAETGASLEETAQALADAKALSVEAGSLITVIGSDQIMEHRGEAFDKPKDLAEAAERLMRLQGDEHTLINAVSVAQNGRVIFQTIERPALRMRAMEREEIDAYIEEAGPVILTSVGAYQVERLGARLFERIDGDYFAVLGLSLFPLLAFLRGQDLLEF